MKLIKEGDRVHASHLNRLQECIVVEVRGNGILKKYVIKPVHNRDLYMGVARFRFQLFAITNS